MATTVSRITSSGTFYVNGNFDEISSLSTGTTNRTDPTGIYYTTNNIDEVSYNPTFPTIKNLANYSQDGTQWGVGANTTIISTTEIAPDGTATAVRVRVTANYGGVRTFNTAWKQAVPVTGSAWVRVDSGTQSMQFGLNGGGLSVNFTATPTWTRFSTGPYTHPVAYDDRFYVFNVNGSGYTDFIVWGFQVELGSTSTMYQGTTSSGSIVTPNFSNRLGPDGTTYITNSYDEVTWNPPIVTSGLVLNLDTANPNSYSGTGNTWTDQTSSNNTVTLVNNPTFTNLNYGALTFDGATNYGTKATTSNFPSGANPFTLSIWFYPTSSAATMSIVSYGVENTGQLVRIRINAGGAYAVVFGHWGGAGYDLGNGSTVNANAWNNVTEVFDGTNDYMYINGVLKGTFTPTALNIPANSSLYIAKRATGEFFTGSVAQTLIYNVALTATEVVQNYNATRDRYGI
jgi:hypothetical protein